MKTLSRNHGVCTADIIQRLKECVQQI